MRRRWRRSGTVQPGGESRSHRRQSTLGARAHGRPAVQRIFPAAPQARDRRM